MEYPIVVYFQEGGVPDIVSIVTMFKKNTGLEITYNNYYPEFYQERFHISNGKGSGVLIDLEKSSIKICNYSKVIRVSYGFGSFLYSLQELGGSVEPEIDLPEWVSLPWKEAILRDDVLL